MSTILKYYRRDGSDSKSLSSIDQIVSRMNASPLFGGYGGGGINMSGTITGAAGSVNAINLSSHAEQYRHYTGWVHSSVRVIAQTISAQPIHVARVATNQTKGKFNRGTKSFDPTEKVFTPSGVFDKKNAMRQMWMKRHLPGRMKSYYETAELIESHPVIDAINNPNPVMPRSSLMFVTSASLELTGKAYWWVEVNQDPETMDDKPINIWYLPAHWCQPVHANGKLFAAWKVIPDGSGVPFYVPREHMVYFCQPDPSNPFGSFATLQAQARAIVSDEAISEAQRQSFQRGIFPGYAVVIGDLPEDDDGKPQGRPVLNKNQRQQIIQAIKKAYQGAYNADEPIILDRLIQDVKKLTNSPKEMEYQKSGDYTKAKITQSFGVNPIVMGAIQDANRASATAAKDNLYDVAVNPRITLISETLENWFSPMFSLPGEKLILFVEECRAHDVESDRDNVDSLFAQGAITRNESRAVFHMPPMDNGETMLISESMKLVPMTMTPEEFNFMTSKTSQSGAPLADGIVDPNNPNDPDNPGNATPAAGAKPDHAANSPVNPDHKVDPAHASPVKPEVHGGASKPVAKPDHSADSPVHPDVPSDPSHNSPVKPDMSKDGELDPRIIAAIKAAVREAVESV
jgi:phage portal protein BeeE